ncbi:hypothetical protein P9112_009887 [Eukaryota sp. TZLM1-RC]
MRLDYYSTLRLLSKAFKKIEKKDGDEYVDMVSGEKVPYNEYDLIEKANYEKNLYGWFEYLRMKYEKYRDFRLKWGERNFRSFAFQYALAFLDELKDEDDLEHYLMDDRAYEEISKDEDYLIECEKIYDNLCNLEFSPLQQKILCAIERTFFNEPDYKNN